MKGVLAAWPYIAYLGGALLLVALPLWLDDAFREGKSLDRLANLLTSCITRLAARRRRNGSCGPLAHRALRILVWLARPWNRGYHRSFRREGALWQAWLARPDEHAWALLPGYMRDRIFTDAVDPGRSAAGRAAIGAFCAARGLAPEDPAERAVFYLLTGQFAQHRAAYPDGALLAAAHRAADEPVRAEVRQALVEAGGLDLVRVIAAADRGRPATITAGQASYLAGQLAGQQDWARLWELAQDLPLIHAPTAMARFASGWQPAGERDRALFDCLAKADLEQVTRARNSLNPIRIRLGEQVRAGSFSPDGRRLVAVAYGDRRPARIYDVRLPDGTVSRRRAKDLPFGFDTSLLCLGEPFLVLGMDRYDLVRRVGDRAQTIWQSQFAAHPPLATYQFNAVPHTAGFCALRRADGGGYCLAFHDGHGRLVRTVSLDELGIGRPSWRSMPRLVAADLASGRLALYCNDSVWLVGTSSGGTQVLAQGPVHQASGNSVSGCFAGPEHLVLAWDQQIQLYQVVGNELSFRRAADVRCNCAPIAIPARGEIMLLDEHYRVVYLDTQTLALVTAPREFAGRLTPLLWASADGRCHAHYDRSSAEVVVVLDPCAAIIAEIADRQQAALTPADLATVTAAFRDGTGGPAARPLLELLAASLHCRFGTEVALGTAHPAQAGPDDIALAAG